MSALVLNFRTRWSALASALLLTLAACGGGDPSTSPPLTPGFAVSLPSTALSVEQGATGTLSATVVRSGGFTGAVDVMVEGLPTGVSASLSPAVIGAGTTSGTLSVVVSTVTAPGSYSFTVRARATGLADQTFTATLTVTPKPTIALTLTPTTERVIHTGSTTFRAVVSRVNFTGAVTLAIAGVPTEVTTTVTQVADTFTVAVAVGLNAFEGSHAITLTASGSGVGNATATWTLQVIPRPASIALSLNGLGSITTSAGGLPVSATIIVRRTEYLGDVAVAVEGTLPTGVSATVVQNPAGSNTYVATFTTTPQATPGTYPITFKGTGTGGLEARVQLSLVVTPFASLTSLALSRPTLVLAQAGTGVTSATIVRSSFTGPVTFAVTGLPAGVTVTFGTNPTSTNGMAITVTVAANAVPGTYAATVSASGAGIATISTPLTLTITLGGQPGNTTFQFCGPANELPIWFGAQPGSRWLQLLPGAPNTYSFDAGNTAGVAWVTQDASNQTTLTVFYGTQEELAAEGARHCTSPSGKRVTGSVTGLGASDRGSVYFGPRSAEGLTSTLPTFTLSGLPDGPRDLVGVRFPGAALQPDRIVIQRAQNPSHNSVLGSINFTNAIVPSTRTVTVQNLGAGEVASVGSFLHTALGTIAPLGATGAASTTAHVASVVPASDLAAGDMHAFTATAGQYSGNAFTEGRVASTYTTSAGAPALALGAALTTPDVGTFSLLNGAIVVRTRFTIQPEYKQLFVMHYAQSSAGATRNVRVTASGAYYEAIGGNFIRMPDLATAAGWQPQWGMLNNILISWTVAAYGWSGTPGLAFPLSDGTVVRGGFLSGSYTPP